MNDGNEYIYCPKCGSKMRKDQRCCLKCGAINYLNEDNDSMEDFQTIADKQQSKAKKEYKFVSSEDAPNRVLYAKHAGSRTLCLFINIFVYLLPIVAFFIFKPIPIDKNLILDYKYSLIFLGYTYIWFFMLGLQLLFMKTDRRWWSIFIPIYNGYKWFEMTMDKGWLVFLAIIPPVGVVLILVSLWHLGERFKKDSFLCLIFPYIMIPNIAYNDDCIYNEVTYSFSRENEEKALMHNFKLNAGLSRYMIFVIIVCAICSGYYWGREFIKYRYVRDVKTIIKYIDKANWACTKDENVNSLDTYYIKFNNAADDLRITLPSEYDVLYKTYKGYIKIVNSNGKRKYYISMTNGYYGVANKEIDEITKEDIEYGTKLNYEIPSNEKYCIVK